MYQGNIPQLMQIIWFDRILKSLVSMMIILKSYGIKICQLLSFHKPYPPWFYILLANQQNIELLSQKNFPQFSSVIGGLVFSVSKSNHTTSVSFNVVCIHIELG